jgi:hypothetical protein
MSPGLLERLTRGLAPHGLLCRGGFHPQPGDDVPTRADGARVATVVMIGNAGPALWPAFTGSPEYRTRQAHALDAWTRRVVDGIAPEVGAEACYPFGGPPHLPFQRWAMRADTVWVSPLQILIHPEFGLWHAYRAALLFVERLALPERAAGARPCDACTDRPCLAACPVDAFTATAYDYARCRDHVRSDAGRACLTTGCLARQACPIGRTARHAPAQAEWHMRGFIG